MKSRIQFFEKSKASIKDDVLSGLTVALALVPEAVAFAFVAGISPVVGLYGAFMMGIITSIFGGRPGMISGATGALAVVMVHLISEGNAMGDKDEMLGLQYLFATLILTGFFQIGAGVLKLGKFVRMIPHSVMMGFVNGLAIVIFTSQFVMFKVDGEWMSGTALQIMIALVLLTMAIMFLLPKITKKIPGALTAIIVVSAIVIFGDLDTSTVKSFIIAGGGDGIKAGLPNFNIPMIQLSWETMSLITPYALILAAIGLIESLMTLNLIDELTETHGNGNKECIAQGSANIVNGFFGGMGGCAMIGQSIINIKSGGRGRLSGIVASLALLCFILFASSYIEKIPIAALVGVMFMVVIGTFAWNSLRLLFIVPRADALVILLVTFVTVMEDLAIAVIVGVIVSALVYAWNAASRIHATARPSDTEIGALVYEIEGPLFFGSATSFMELFEPETDPEIVILDFMKSRVVDQSALQAIEAVAKKYKSAGKRLMLRHLSSDCHRLLNKSGQLTVMQNDDPDYELAVDYDVQIGRFSSSH